MSFFHRYCVSFYRCANAQTWMLNELALCVCVGGDSPNPLPDSVRKLTWIYVSWDERSSTEEDNISALTHHWSFHGITLSVNTSMCTELPCLSVPSHNSADKTNSYWSTVQRQGSDVHPIFVIRSSSVLNYILTSNKMCGSECKIFPLNVAVAASVVHPFLTNRARDVYCCIPITLKARADNDVAPKCAVFQ